MTTIWNEDQVTLPNLAQHFKDCGKDRVELQDDDEIHLYTENGLYHRVSIDDQRFLRLGTYLPTDKFRSHAEKLELIQRLNRQLFLTSFFLDDEDDVIVDFAISYQTGLIIGQFMILLNRFGSMLDYIVEHENAEGLIQFDHYGLRQQSIASTVSTIGSSDDKELFSLDGTRPKNVVLN